MRQAARLMGHDQKTIKKYIDNGMVKWRDPFPYSDRPTYMIELDSLLALRTTYRTSRPTPPPKNNRRTRVSAARQQSRHINWN
jgi:hypothetical protein